MDGVYERNINALEKFQRNYTLSQIGTDAENAAQPELVTLSGGALDIKYTHKGAPVYIHGGGSPVETAISRTAQIELKGNGLIVSFGLGLGYEVREIIGKMSAGTNFVIVEPSREVLELALRSVDLTDIISAPNVHFFDFSGKEEGYFFFRRFINQHNFGNLSAFVVAPYTEIFFMKCRDLFFVIEDLRASFAQGETTVKSFTALWQKNALQNLKHCVNSHLVSDFFGKFAKTPAVIVSAGPSLSKNIGLLEKMEDRCLIISVDTALKPLFERGIKPHFVVSLDAQDIVKRKFEGLDYSGIPLVYVPTSSAPVVGDHGGIKLLSPVQFDYYTKLLLAMGKDASRFEMGGSVATGAFSFAQMMGCDPIVLIGQDLAFTDMKSHIEGTAFYHELEASKIPGVLSVESVDGKTVYTDRTFLSYITWLQTYAASDKTGRTYIDATQGGAKILGFECETLENTIRRYMNEGGVLERVRRVFEEAPLLAASEKKRVRESFKAAVSFTGGLAAPAKEASRQLGIIYGLLSKKKPNLSAINSAYAKTSSFETVISGSGGLLDVIGIALAPIMEKLNADFLNADFKTDLEKNRFAALCYSKYYGEIAALSEQYAPILKSEAELL